ncbi:hypothetical protein ONS96_004226 [Cadophora gregata f. sp. sojae]|nr:hypothetical protein ONS96_004226 [Cadophora gregata f. sp. sojae]
MTVSIQQDTRFSSLDTATKQIMEALLDLPRTVRQDMDNQFQHLLRIEHLEHGKTRAAFMDHIRTQLDDHVCHSIIESVHFPTRTVRHDNIPEAHKQTFEWIFRDPIDDGKPWSNFAQWLETGDGIYWINGKVGSGKSTLMKFIVDHEKTSELLGAWAPGKSVETPTFFFWKNGHKDQRSQGGLLRSLLYDILRKYPALVPIVFPDVWTRNSELASHSVSSTLDPWSLTKLQKAFARLVVCKTIRVCFFIDGLDEYEGDHEELAAFFAQLSCTPNVKLCLSSRPWPAFQDTFRNHPGLRLQDLTCDDIRRFVNDKINGNSRMVLLRQREPERAAWFVQSLIWKAEGVFLWVTPVVKSLLKGLSHKNDLETLEKRLGSMPPDLEKLYSHMLSMIDSHDMKKGSELFQLFEVCGVNKDLELIYFASSREVAEVLSTKPVVSRQTVDEAQHVQFDSIVEEMSIYLQACCGGLIEIFLDDPDRSWRTGELTYIHRSVEEYLATPEIWSGILSHTSKSSWDPQTRLLKSSILCLRNSIWPGPESMEQSVNYVERHWCQLMDHIDDILDDGPVSYEDGTLILNNFDKAAADFALLGCWAQRYTEKFQRKLSHWSECIQQPALPRQGFVHLAAECQLWFCVKHLLENDPSLVSKLEVPLLAHILLSINPMFVNREGLDKTVQVVLSFSANPNEVFHGYSIWQYWVTFLHTVYRKGSHRSPMFETWRKVTIEMIKAGADLNIGCAGGRTVWLDLYQELQKGDELYTSRVSYENIWVGKLVIHSDEAWRRLEWDSHMHRLERKLFAGKESLSFEERHSLKAVIEDTFRDDDPKGTDEVLELIESLEAEQASGKSEVPIRERKLKG